MDFHEIYIQKGTYQSPTLKKCSSDFGIYAVEVPYIGLPNVKEPYKNDWHDENGDDEYLPSSPVFDAQEITLTLAYRGTGGNGLKNFFDFITKGEYSIYTECGKWGRQKVRYVDYDTDAYYFKDSNSTDVLVFKVKFKVNDPISIMALFRNQGGDPTCINKIGQLVT